MCVLVLGTIRKVMGVGKTKKTLFPEKNRKKKSSQE
jgi:hypothetical protein